jgi:hypothetical protein
VLQPEREYLTAPACRLLTTKITQILNQKGIVNDLPSNRFVLTAKANVLSKDIIAGSPSRISERIELTFIIGDILENKKYGSYAMPLTGVGLNEQQAIQMAIKSINNNDPGLNSFIEQSKERIIQYYIDNEVNIINQADLLFAKGEYEEALYLLSLVPEGASDCYIHCQNKMQEIVRKKIDSDGETLFNKAKAAWAKNPNAEGAEEVFPLISAINTSAACYKKITPFLNSISAKLVADEKRAWDFKMKQYEDQKAREQRDFEFKVQQYQDEKSKEQRNFEAREANAARNAEIRRREISAARDVAMEFARNQPQTVTYETNNTILVW